MSPFLTFYLSKESGVERPIPSDSPLNAAAWRLAKVAYAAKASAVALGTGIAPTRLSHHHVADLRVPIACAGVAVCPGDVIHGDADGCNGDPRAPRCGTG